MGNDNKTHREFIGALYAEISKKMFKYAKLQLRDNYLADVAVQEAMLVALQRADTLINTSNPAGWVFEVLRRILKNMLSENAKIGKRLISLNDCVENDLHTLDEINLKILYDGIISEEEFYILEKLYVRGYTYKDLADEMNMPISTIGMKAKRGKEKLRKNLEK